MMRMAASKMLVLLAATTISTGAFAASVSHTNTIAHAYTANEVKQLPWPVGQMKDPGITSGACTYFCGEHQNNDAYAVDFHVVYAPVSATLAGIAHPTTIVCLGDSESIVWIDHGGGLISYYAHLDPNNIFVADGQAVAQGQVLALSGNSGSPNCSTGPHLHFAMHSGATTWNDGYAYVPEPMAAPSPDVTYGNFGYYGLPPGCGCQSPRYTAAVSSTEYRPSAVSWGSLRLDLFMRGKDNGFWHRYTGDDVTWGPAGWENLGSAGGGFTGEPATASWGSGRLDVFGVAADGNLYHKYWDSVGCMWCGWGSALGNGGYVMKGTPSAAAYGPGNLAVVARAVDGSTNTLRWDGNQWVWFDIGGYTQTDPVVISPGTNSLEAVILGSDNHVWHAEWSPNQWTSWQQWNNPPGVTFVSQPTETYLSANNLDVLALGSDGNLWDRHSHGAGWNDWLRLVGNNGPTTIVGSPSATEWPAGSGLFSLMVRDSNGAIWDCWPTLGSNLPRPPVSMDTCLGDE